MIKQPITKILFLDIETVGLEKNYDEHVKKHPRVGEQFDKYFDWFLKRFPEDSTIGESELEWKNEVFVKRAALVPEFAKIVCVSMAFVMDNGEVKKQTFSGDNEYELLKII
jgi:hypothetical protein